MKEEWHSQGGIYTVDREIISLKIICVKFFVVLNFRGSFDPQIFLTVHGYNMGERLGRS